MNARITPHPLGGSIRAHASKSLAHRILILAALADTATNIECDSSSDDIDATLRCLTALGAHVAHIRGGLRVTPMARVVAGGANTQELTELDVGESGTTLRLLLPVICALGEQATITGHGRLAQRPIAPLREALCAHGCTISRPGAFPLHVRGKLHGGAYTLPGNVSSQYVSGLLMAAAALGEDVNVAVSEPVESLPYVRLTVDVLARFGIAVHTSHADVDGKPCFLCHVDGAATPRSPGAISVEGDWSNAGFWFAAGALSPAGIKVEGLDLASAQGDRVITAACALFGATVRRDGDGVMVTRDALRSPTIDVRDTPDLAAPLAAIAAHASGTTLLNGADRLALKESNRLRTITAAINGLGGKATHANGSIVIDGGRLSGGTVDASGDHRIAMMASVIAAFAEGPSTIMGAECVEKSYPTFFEDFAALGGNVRMED